MLSARRQGIELVRMSSANSFESLVFRPVKLCLRDSLRRNLDVKTGFGVWRL
jgi:hypothetical protein